MCKRSRHGLLSSCSIINRVGRSAYSRSLVEDCHQQTMIRDCNVPNHRKMTQSERMLLVFFSHLQSSSDLTLLPTTAANLCFMRGDHCLHLSVLGLLFRLSLTCPRATTPARRHPLALLSSPRQRRHRCSLALFSKKAQLCRKVSGAGCNRHHRPRPEAAWFWSVLP